jgi:hypothetical protein
MASAPPHVAVPPGRGSSSSDEGRRETRWIISVMIQHDLYHAGEINHVRSLLSGDDRWLFEREEAAATS